jgi:hypothetical protein
MARLTEAREHLEYALNEALLQALTALVREPGFKQAVK